MAYFIVFVFCPFFVPSWVGFEHSSYNGQQFVLEKGDYPCFEAYMGSHGYRVERMMSFRPIYSAVSSSKILILLI